MKVLYVCTGNINRSAAADVITRSMAPHLEVRSAATNQRAGKIMARLMRDTLAGRGFDGSGHRSTALTTDLVQWADLIIGFQPSHLTAVAAMGGTARSLVEYGPAQGLRKIPDPHFDGTGATHEYVVSILLATIPIVYDLPV